MRRLPFGKQDLPGSGNFEPRAPGDGPHLRGDFLAPEDSFGAHRPASISHLRKGGHREEAASSECNIIFMRHVVLPT